MTQGAESKRALHTLRAGSKAASYLHALRWISALYVMIYHLRPVLFKGYSQLEHKSLLMKMLYASTSLGYEFVMLFFVLSGYLISVSVLKAVRDGSWSWKTYLINRVTRLWVVLISALFLTYVWAQFQLMIFPSSAFFIDNLGWSDFLGNLFFLQGMYFFNYGGNLPLWSLSLEFWYYILFPCLALSIASRRWLSRIGYGAVFAGVGYLLGQTIMLYFLIWLLGTLLVIAPAPRWSQAILTRILMPILWLCCCLIPFVGKYLAGEHDMDIAGRFNASLLVAVFFAGFIFVILHAYNRQPSALAPGKLNIHAFLAGFSYTLYLTHYPVVNFVRVWLGDGRWGVWNPDLHHLLLGALIAAAIVVYAWLIAYFTESQTDTVRKAVTRLLQSNRNRRRNHEHLSNRYGLD